MNWITKEQVKEAAKDKMTALQCSRDHHDQGATCKQWELMKAIEDGMFYIDPSACACCEKYDCCDNKCPLSKDGMYGKCCGGNFRTMELVYKLFKEDPTPAHFTAFQAAEVKVRDYIQAVIDKEAEPEVILKHGDYCTPKSGEFNYVCLQHKTKEDMWEIHAEHHINGVVNKTNHYYQSTGKSIFDNINAKQTKVGPEAESKGKQELKVELVTGDYGGKGSQSWIKVHDKIWWLHEFGQKSASILSESNFVKDKLGNLNDDLTKECDGFDVNGTCADSIKVELSPKSMKSDVVISITGCDARLDLEGLDEFITGLCHTRNFIRNQSK